MVSFVFSGISQSLIDVGALPFHTKGLDAGVNGWLGCLWHAADTAPLEGLSILRCAIYDPVEGLQISKMRFSEMGV